MQMCRSTAPRAEDKQRRLHFGAINRAPKPTLLQESTQRVRYGLQRRECGARPEWPIDRKVVIAQHAKPAANRRAAESSRANASYDYVSPPHGRCWKLISHRGGFNQ